ncbi:hypothetical protein BU15DRAFT_81796 [Melanogaster broomeanus]|nr:hypothetical protein BU15DRAFT_81796 [Melanogaster broomeanus]
MPPLHHLAFFIQHLFSSTVIILLYAMHSPDPRATATAMDEAKSCILTIESWEGHWPGARKCKELLIELMSTADDAIRKVSNADRQATDMPMPPTVAPAALERRQSLVTSSSGQVLPVSRSIKMKPRRISRSRDPASTWRPPVASYRVDSQRNRSTSRKRGRDDHEGVPGSSMGAYSAVFSSPQSIGGKSSPHSSPASVDLPSPSMSTMETTQQQEGSPRLMGAAPYNYTGTPLSPLHVPLPYDYGMHHSPLASAGGHQWETSRQCHG